MSPESNDRYGPRKIAAFLPVSQELVDSFMRPSIIERLFRGPDERTDEQRAADRAAREAKLAAERAEILHRHAQLLAAAEHPLLRAVLELHQPVVEDYRYEPAICHGCDMEGYECDWPEFPCSTYALIADAFSPVGGTQ